MEIPSVLLLPQMVLMKFLFTFQLDIYSVLNINYREHFTPIVSVTHSLMEGVDRLSTWVAWLNPSESFPWSLSSSFAGEEGFGAYWSLPIRRSELALRAERLCSGLVVTGITESWPRPAVSDSVSVESLHFSLAPWWCSQCCRSGNHISRTSVLTYRGSRQGVWSVLSLFCLPWWLSPGSPMVGQRIHLPRVY